MPPLPSSQPTTDGRRFRFRSLAGPLSLLLVFAGGGCDHGLEPVTRQQGHIRAFITYEGPWPTADSLFDLRFVAMRFVPQDTSDLLELTRITFSEHTLRYNVRADTVVISGVDAGPFVYSGVAHQYTRSLFSWRPVGLVEENGGLFFVQPDETTDVFVRADFWNRPPFPPPTD